MGTKAFLFAPIVFVSLVLSACVGGAVVYPKKEKYTHFSVSSLSRSLPIAGYRPDHNPTKSEITAAWGKADEIIIQRRQEQIWKYTNGFNWYGVVPMIGIGIPLVLPVSRDYTEVYFKGDNAEWAVFSHETWSGGCWCPDNEGNMKYGFRKLEN
jgi:hypothetical protein